MGYSVINKTTDSSPQACSLKEASVLPRLQSRAMGLPGALGTVVASPEWRRARRAGGHSSQWTVDNWREGSVDGDGDGRLSLWRGPRWLGTSQGAGRKPRTLLLAARPRSFLTGLDRARAYTPGPRTERAAEKQEGSMEGADAAAKKGLQRQQQNLHMHLLLACFAGACVQVLRTLSCTRNQQSAAVSLCKVHVGTAGRPFRIRDYVLCGFSPFP
ncbi:hypothetical protein VFPFJ_02420 [Purpureocillium lilacinum]|uniref:Uncharacterized protein n=1 Tax=Purpureocillium lilacinum TaxID=33203 RepID=A0A179HUY9_PURLI|nr:hypothetical protein VFPFJ_02420 [Purpureocillium lilacinum]OAQ78989.1 hypothetical protein VFPBJ_07110 [Purpureocillium lilacinum]OAQ93259.1 hypothetical protein VFPFJ_02420 [Purpureocillium lilacinum]